VALVSGAGRLDLPGFVEQMSTAAAWKLAARVPSAMTLAYLALSRLGRRSPGAARKVLFSGIPKTDGQEDTTAPPAHAEYWIETLQATRAVWLENAGHFLIEDHVEEVLDLLGT
jgi:pimeloyl-ACP methyl ester carboxylesterase